MPGSHNFINRIANVVNQLIIVCHFFPVWITNWVRFHKWERVSEMWHWIYTWPLSYKTHKKHKISRILFTPDVFPSFFGLFIVVCFMIRSVSCQSLLKYHQSSFSPKLNEWAKGDWNKANYYLSDVNTCLGIWKCTVLIDLLGNLQKTLLILKEEDQNYLSLSKASLGHSNKI